jgi:hypothetical protein
MHGCMKRRFSTYKNASKILYGGKFKVILKTSQIYCLWADSNNLMKKRHRYYSVFRSVARTLLKQQSCVLAQYIFICMTVMFRDILTL